MISVTGVTENILLRSLRHVVHHLGYFLGGRIRT